VGQKKMICTAVKREFEGEKRVNRRVQGGKTPTRFARLQKGFPAKPRFSMPKDKKKKAEKGRTKKATSQLIQSRSTYSRKPLNGLF